MQSQYQKTSDNCFNSNSEKCAFQRKDEPFLAQGQDSNAIQTNSDIGVKKVEEKYFVLKERERGEAFEFISGDETQRELPDSTSGSCIPQNDPQGSKSPAAEMSDSIYPISEDSLVFEDQSEPGYHSPGNSIGKQSDSEPDSAIEYEWRMNTDRNRNDKNKQEWIVDFPSTRPQNYRPSARKNRINFPYRVQFQQFHSRTAELDFQHCLPSSSGQQVKPGKPWTTSPAFPPCDQMQNLEEIDEDYRRFNEQLRTKCRNVRQKTTETGGWRNRIGRVFRILRERVRKMLTRRTE
ncbi:hypothetical protein NPIL_471221 [Nephila pilipes]|uniref:Uncharacterized protein n=1 Tax=Nephila pilipes TaxID=299642 RepID=A0A8X6NK17_NEPPI|nr:hypothetical protein NPIL_471221 [Nephila pilipes]